MDYNYIKKGSGKRTFWSGGTTYEHAIFPNNGNYALRSFIWRLSSSTIEEESSTFTDLPDFDRVMLITKGNLDISHDDREFKTLAEYDIDYFGGDVSTKTKGTVSDYNLIIRKGNRGFLSSFDLKPEGGNITPVFSDEEIEAEKEYDYAMNAYYLVQGYAVANIKGDTIMLKEGDQLIINKEASESIDLTLLGDGKIIKASAYFSYNTNAYGPTIIPPEKATFEDYLACLFLSNTQFRYADKIFKSINDYWYDEFLSSKIKKLETYCITFFVWLTGMLLIMMAVFDDISGFLPWFIVIVGWTAFDSIILSPLIYLFALPKPVAKHIKKITELTPYEADLYEKQQNTNERVEKILKKYKNVYRK